MGFDKNGSLTLEQIREAEKKIGHKFPEDYKEFLLKTNGGRIDLDDDVEHGFHVEPIDEEDIWIDFLYGIGEDAYDNLIYYNKEYGEETMGCIIIGTTLSNGFLLYDYAGVWDDENHEKAIYFWDDTRAYETSSDDGNLYYVAKDFNDLLKRASLNFDE